MIIAFDTETELIRADCLAPRLVCVTFDDGRILRWDDARPAVEEALRGEVVGQNVAYDMGVVCAQWPDLLPTVFTAYREGRVHDTKIRQQLIDIANGEFRFRTRPDGKTEKPRYSLADLSLRLLGEYVSKGEDTWRLRYGELRLTPVAQWPAEAVHYAVKDAVITRRVCDAQGGEIVDEAAQCRAAWWIHLMASWGICVDPAKAHLLEKEVREEYETVARALLEEGLVRREKDKYVRNTKVVKERVLRAFEAMGREPLRTPKGDVSIGEEVCEDSGDEDLSAYAKLSSLGNILSKDFSRGVDKKTGLPKPSLARTRIHASFNSLVANGRTSCRGFNLQNMRADGETRHCFAPPPGFVYLTCDLAVAELRAVAQACIWLFGSSRLADAINQGDDPHCMLCATRLSRDYVEVMRLYEDGDKTIKNERQLDKRSNFGYWAGMGPKTLGKQIKTYTGVVVPLAKLYEMQRAWKETWAPEADRYLALHGEMAEAGPITIEQFVSGRVRKITEKNRYAESANTRFSGLVADAAKAAGFALSEEMYIGDGELRGSRLVIFAHDEFVAEVPEELGHECAIRAREVILREVGRYMPDVPPATTPILSRVWSKEAKQVIVNGRIVPWEPERKAA